MGWRFFSVSHPAAPGWHRNTSPPLFFSRPSAKHFLGGGGGSPGCRLTHFCKPASTSVGFSPGLFGCVMSERRCLHPGD